MEGIIKRGLHNTVLNTLDFIEKRLQQIQEQQGLTGEDPALVMFSFEEIIDVLEEAKLVSRKSLNI